VNGASGYEISRATKKKGKYIIIARIKKGKTVQYTNSRLKKNATYYYRIRAYRQAGKTKVYGPYSSVRSQKVTK